MTGPLSVEEDRKGKEEDTGGRKTAKVCSTGKFPGS